MKKITENVKEQFLSDISQKKMFEEVQDNQCKIIKEREDRDRQKKIEDQNQKVFEVQEKQLAEEKKRGEANKRNEKYQKDFLELSEQCNINKISDLALYQSDQSELKKDLKEIADIALKFTEEK